MSVATRMPGTIATQRLNMSFLPIGNDRTVCDDQAEAHEPRYNVLNKRLSLPRGTARHRIWVHLRGDCGLRFASESRNDSFADGVKD